ncbi:unnamed protein product [Somion occarium]|uniref:Uncharacterized protein n=1 Tax=Somion occarium TaxID=3059160 RepID=A0ABP1DC23_9APHY
MARELRKRTSRPNYAALANYGEEPENEAGPSTTHRAAEDDDGSSSDFAPDKDVVHDVTAEVDEVEADAEGEDQVSQLGATSGDEQVQSLSTSKRKKPTKRKPRKSAATVAESGQLPLPNVHHRHRAVPLYHRHEKVERLTEPPKLFTSPRITLTNSSTANSVVGSRVNKAWGCNVGPGPLWELLEDRGWYKEYLHAPKEAESFRRPKVHSKVMIPSNCETLQPEAGSVYLPTHDDQSPSRSIPCSFGPIDQQQRLELGPLSSVGMHAFSPGNKSHVFNAGAPVWGLDWCPIHPDVRQELAYKQYLAVAPLTSQTHDLVVGSRLPRPAHSCVEIWSLSPSRPENASAVDDTQEQPGMMQCEMIVCIEAGSAFELKWCPLPSHDNLSAPFDPASPLRKLGILAGAFEDGSISLYAISDPTDLANRTGASNDALPVFVRLSEPLLRLEMEDTTPSCLDWANSDVLGVGCSNGWIAVYNVGKALRDGERGLNKLVAPTHYFSIHQSAVRSVAWIRVPTPSVTGEPTTDDPTVIATGGFDGLECVADIRDLAANTLNRTRDVVNCVSFSTYCGGPVTIDHENTIKAYSLSPSMLGRGHRLLEPEGPIWSVAASDYHPQLAIGVADGSCMTTNTMRSTRRGGMVPFLAHKVYQLDYSRQFQEYRMLEHFLPQETTDRPSVVRGGGERPSSGAGAWSPEVGIHRVVWNMGNGLAAAPLLASATGSGLCRVDWLMGRWMRDRIPYNGVEVMRQETDAEDMMDEDSE